MKNRKFSLKILALMIAISLILSINVNIVSASTLPFDIKGEDVSSEIGTRVANVIKVSAAKRSDNQVRINCLNIGVDTFDKVTCNVMIVNKSGIVQYNKTITFTNIFPLISQYVDIYVANWATVYVSNIQCYDGTDYGVLPDFSLSN